MKNIYSLKRFILLIVFTILASFSTKTQAQTTDFIFKIDPTAAGSASGTFVFPATGGAGGYNIFVDGVAFGAGGFTTATTITGLGTATHTIRVSGNLSKVEFVNAGDRLKMLSIEQWGSAINWTSFVNAYYGCTNLVLNTTDTPVLTGVTIMTNAFRESGITSTGNLSSWNVSKVIAFNAMFYNNPKFNQNLSAWNTNGGGFSTTAPAINMDNMFGYCYLFNNGDVPGGSANPLNWTQTSKVNSMGAIFQGCSVFNQNVNNLDTSANTYFGYMFESCLVYNQPVNTWNISKGTNFIQTFNNCPVFNQNVSAWNTTGGGFNTATAITMNSMFGNCLVFNNGETTNTAANPLNWTTTSKVTDMQYMFYNCQKFNQNLNNLDTSANTFFNSMFSFDALYDQPMNTWNVSKSTTFYQTFYNCNVLNQDLTAWGTTGGGINTSAGVNISMFRMFNSCFKFNNGDVAGGSSKSLCSWNTSRVTDMQETFYGCTVFNQPMNCWNVSNNTNFYYTFALCRLSTNRSVRGISIR